jgi:Pyruvate/2-oxoacid:ferredoxin oxidoreductase gamma subunit
VVEFLRGKGYEVSVCPALARAVELGEKRCANVILLGLLSRHLTLSSDSWQAAIERRFPKQYLDLNRRAFEAGREACA